MRDTFAGFEAQWRPWWRPWWSQVFGVNTHPTLESAVALVREHARTRGVAWRDTDAQTVVEAARLVLRAK